MSRLVLKSKALNDETVRTRYVEMFARHDIDADRLDLRPSSPHEQLLAEYNDIDIALDPFPYSGGLTTIEALYMGVPVITHPGDLFSGRHAVSHISNVGLTDWVCSSSEAYLALAVKWANDLDALSTLRGQLRDQVLASPLCDAKRFARNFESALRDVWTRWCDSQPAMPTKPDNETEKMPAPQPIHHISSDSQTYMDSPAIFIGGHSRTGTTLMHGQICKSEETIEVTKESSYLRALMEAHDLGSQWFSIHTDDYFDTQDEFSTFHAELLNHYFEHVAKRFGPNQRIVQKEPRMTAYFPELAQAMPNAKFIYMLRDPRDIIASQMTRSQKNGSQMNVGADITRFVTTFQRLYQNKELLKDRLLFVRYEALALEPAETLKGVFEFLGLPWGPQMEETSWTTKRASRDESASALDGQAIQASSIGRYLSVLPDTLITELNKQKDYLTQIVGASCYLDDGDEVDNLMTFDQEGTCLTEWAPHENKNKNNQTPPSPNPPSAAEPGSD